MEDPDSLAKIQQADSNTSLRRNQSTYHHVFIRERTSVGLKTKLSASHFTKLESLVSHV